MKKIFKYFFTFVFAFILLGSISVFASEPSAADFKENFQIYRFLSYNGAEDLWDYSYNNDEDGDGRSTSAVFVGSDTVTEPPKSFGYAFRIQSDDSRFRRFMPGNYVLSGLMYFNVLLPFDEVTDLERAVVLLYDRDVDDFWNTGRPKVSDIQFHEKIATYEYGTEWRCSAVVYYKNDSPEVMDCRKIGFQFMFRLKNQYRAASSYRFAAFDMEVQDYYYGPISNPNAPSFNDFEDFKQGVDDYHVMEQEVDDLFKSTFDTYLDFGSWETLLTHIMPGITLSTNLLNSWFRLSFLDTLLFASMFIGIFAFLIGCFPSLVSAARFAAYRRTRDDYYKRNKKE